MGKQLTPQVALQRAAALCAQSEQCIVDIRKKLRTWGITSDERNKIIDKLVDKNFINEERYAQAFAHDKLYYNGWGPRKIAVMLQQKMLPSQLIGSAIASLDEADIEQKLYELLRQSARSLDLSQRSEREKLARRLISRGFPVGPVFKAINSYITGPDYHDSEN